MKQFVILGYSLALKEDNGIVNIPHLNIRGIVSKLSGDKAQIELSEESQDFLSTPKIDLTLTNANINLKENDDVFVKFNIINIKEKTLTFKSIEVYKYYETIEKHYIGSVSWSVPNDFGGILTMSGTEFEYNGNKYVDSDEDYSKDGKKYFVDIYDGKLLYEEYKNMFPPMKWYNMVNPQETYFDVIVDIYKNRRT